LFFFYMPVQIHPVLGIDPPPYFVGFGKPRCICFFVFCWSTFPPLIGGFLRRLHHSPQKNPLMFFLTTLMDTDYTFSFSSGWAVLSQKPFPGFLFLFSPLGPFQPFSNPVVSCFWPPSRFFRRLHGLRLSIVPSECAQTPPSTFVSAFFPPPNPFVTIIVRFLYPSVGWVRTWLKVPHCSTSIPWLY